MPHKKIIILDGTRSGDKHLNAILALLTEELECQGTKIQTFSLRDIQLHRCIGCFNCWSKTPGRCIHTDAGAKILESILNSDTLIFFTPVIFGGYSSELKKIVDRLLPIVLPFFKKVDNDGTRHLPRYSSFPRLVGIGVHPRPQKELSDCFKLLVGRNAANFRLSSYAAEVVSSTKSPETLQSQFQALLSKTDKPPGYKELNSLRNNTVAVPSFLTGNRRVLFILGSPKIKNPSTSAVLGNSLLKRLQLYGWKTETLSLSEDLLYEKEQGDLCSAVDRADTILTAFPLYVDTLPFLVTKAFEVIARHRETVHIRQPKNILAIVNNGYPEAHHNTVALSICRNFALELGMTWIGGLAMGGGEGLLSGQPVASFTGLRGVKRPPLYYINRALNITAAALAEGCPVPEKAIQLIAKKPVPFIPYDLWRWIYIKTANRVWKKEAVKNGLKENALLDKPYAKKQG